MAKWILDPDNLEPSGSYIGPWNTKMTSNDVNLIFGPIMSQNHYYSGVTPTLTQDASMGTSVIYVSNTDTFTTPGTNNGLKLVMVDEWGQEQEIATYKSIRKNLNKIYLVSGLQNDYFVGQRIIQKNRYLERETNLNNHTLYILKLEEGDIIPGNQMFIEGFLEDEGFLILRYKAINKKINGYFLWRNDSGFRLAKAINSEEIVVWESQFNPERIRFRIMNESNQVKIYADAYNFDEEKWELHYEWIDSNNPLLDGEFGFGTENFAFKIDKFIYGNWEEMGPGNIITTDLYKDDFIFWDDYTGELVVPEKPYVITDQGKILLAKLLSKGGNI